MDTPAATQTRRCLCVMRDWIADDKLPPVCGSFQRHDGEFWYACAECSHEQECHTGPGTIKPRGE